MPPVPTPATKRSTSPAVSSQISTPVVSKCFCGLAGFTNCPSVTALGRDCLISSAFAKASFIPPAPEVSTTSAPKAVTNRRRSMLIVSGITIIALYPFTAATKASPTPVLPLVASTRVAPGASFPSRSAASTIASAARSFTEPAGLKDSSLTSTRALSCKSAATR